MADVVPARRRIVSIEVDPGGDAWDRFTYGSGLLIGGQQVLTAAHVVQGAQVVSIRRGNDAAPWTADASSMLCGDVEVFDIAVIDVDDAEALDDVPVARVNRDGGGQSMLGGCWAVGFPAFRRRRETDTGPLIRESAQVDGTIPPLSGLRSGLLSLRVTDAPRDLPEHGSLDEDSAWSGMSGAAVFAGDLLVGVVTEHIAAAGPSDITVTPLDALLDPERPLSHRSQWWRRLGVRDPEALPLVPAPSTPAQDAPAPETSAPPELASVLAGMWIVDVQTPMGTETMRLALDATQKRFQGEGIAGLPGWQANGGWMVLPGDRVAMQGAQASPARYPPQWPLQEVFQFTSVSPDALQGRNSAGFPVTWRRS